MIFDEFCSSVSEEIIFKISLETISKISFKNFLCSNFIHKLDFKSNNTSSVYGCVYSNLSYSPLNTEYSNQIYSSVINIPK